MGFLKNIFSKKANRKGWNRNTHLGVNVKTILRNDRSMKIGKDYVGVLKRDVECDEFYYDEHFTFVETLPWSMKRNPRVFNGRYISVTRRDDGTYRLNLKPVKMDNGFNVERYIAGVANEMLWALLGLVGNK